MSKRGLVISGGGSRGAFAGGIVEYLKESGISWNTGSGSSTGALLLPLSLYGDIDTLKEYYTTITNDDIFSIDAFNKKGKIRIFNAVWRLIRGKTSFGEAENLLTNIRATLDIDKWKALKESGTNAHIAVTNYTKGKTEYKCIQDHTYEDYTKYMLASASVPGAFDIVTLEGNQYLDGGILESVPLQKMVDDGCDEIDIIVLKVKEDSKENEINNCNNILDILSRTIELMNREIGYDDIDLGTLSGSQSQIKLNFYYLPHQFTTSPLTFDTDAMKALWNKGYEYAKNKEKYKEVLIKKYKSGYKVK